MKRIFCIALTVLFLTACSVSAPVDRNKDMTITSLDTGTRENFDVITILYPYVFNKNEYNQIFHELNYLSKDIIGITVEMLTAEEDPSVRSIMHANDLTYCSALKSLMDAGLGPDIFVAAGTFNLEPGSFPNSLLNAVKSGYAADITEYINAETPFLNRFYQQYDNLLPMLSYQGKIYGISTPVTYMQNTVFFVHKTVSPKLSSRSFRTFQEALEACIEINEKELSGPEDRVYVSPGGALKNIIQEAGYYQGFFEYIRYMYYFQLDDEAYNIHRIEETRILEDIFTYRDVFEQNRIESTTVAESTGFYIAGITSYAHFLSESLKSNENKLHYDVHFLEGENIVYTSQTIPYQLNSFVVNTSCMNKQGAVKYIDWLYSNPEANKLMKYGIKDVNYKTDSSGFLYIDNTVKEINRNYSLFSGYTVEQDVFSPESIYAHGEDEAITDQILRNFKVYPFMKMVIKNIMESKEYSEGGSIAEKLSLLEKTGYKEYRQKEITLGMSLPDLFDYHKEANFSDIFKILSDSRNDSFMNELQEIINEIIE